MYIYGVKNARRTAQVHVSPSDSNSKNLTFFALELLILVQELCHLLLQRATQIQAPAVAEAIPLSQS